MIQSATDTRSRGSASVSSADFYMVCMFARVVCVVCRMVVDVCILNPSGASLSGTMEGIFSFHCVNLSLLSSIFPNTNTQCPLRYGTSHVYPASVLLKVMEPMFTSCSRLQQRIQDLIIYRQQSKQGLMIPSMTNNFATAQAVYHSENK